jgi:hypothetical protein
VIRDEPNQPINIFIIAEQFRCASKCITIVPAMDIPVVRLFPKMPTVAMVCSAFALELYFKCLIRLGRKSYGSTHDLEELFELISQTNQAKIRRLWRANSATVRAHVESFHKEAEEPAPRVDFKYVLSASKMAFVQIRYIFEKGIEPDKGWLGDTIIEAARQVILNKHPTWENARQTAPLPKTSLGPTYQVP